MGQFARQVVSFLLKRRKKNSEVKPTQINMTSQIDFFVVFMKISRALLKDHISGLFFFPCNDLLTR